jgi:hypothetical protein
MSKKAKISLAAVTLLLMAALASFGAPINLGFITLTDRKD